MYLPPCDKDTRSAQRLLVKQMKKYILKHAENDNDAEKMTNLLFDVLSSLDGFYNEFPKVSLVTVEGANIISGYLHEMLCLEMHFILKYGIEKSQYSSSLEIQSIKSSHSRSSSA